MKKFVFGVVLLCLQFSSHAQSEKDKINRDVWYNFMQAYQDLNASLFNKIHTEDALRIPADQNTMLIGREYKDENLDKFNHWNRLKIKQKIEFSFLNRVQKNDWAYETGIYKLTRYNGYDSQCYFGKFNVTLKKIEGRWKIYIDSDISENSTIDQEEFLQGELLK